MDKIEKDLKKLCSRAREYGASAAVPIPASEVVVDPRVLLKCMVPICAGYGVNLMCPPNVMSPDEFSEVLALYHNAILIQFPISVDENFMKTVAEDEPLSKTRRKKAYRDPLVKSDREFVEILCRLEKDALELGYRFATGLSAGTCRLCDECVGQESGEPCRQPFRARPSMEAVGIDVVKTAERAGISFEFPAKRDPVWVGLLLVD